MKRSLIATIATAVMAVGLTPDQASGSVAEALEAERQGRAVEARSLLRQAAEDSPRDPQALLAHAEFLDRYGDPGALEAYRLALEVAGSEQDRRHVARRLAVLESLAGNTEGVLRAIEAYSDSGGSGLSAGAASGSNPETEGYGQTQIPGLFDGFLRMAALSTDLEPIQLLPALARNIVTGGYRTSRGGEALQETEYLKLLRQYLSQARELSQFAGADSSLDVPACESAETAQLLKVLGYRLRSECGSDAVLETVNPSRAFLSIDSAFPLAELEDAYRRDAEFHHPYAPTNLPVLFGPEYWIDASEKKAEGEFVDVFLGDPSLARLYVALSKMHRPTALALRQAADAKRLKNYANVFDFFGESFEIRDGAAVVPGGAGAAAAWAELAGVSPAQGPEFFIAMAESDDGWMAAFYDAVSRTGGPAKLYLTQPSRMRRFYDALRGKITSPGPARPIFRATSELLLLSTRLRFNSDGQPLIPGGVATWKDLFVSHPHGKYDGKLTKSANNWQSPDDVLEALFALSRKVVENEPLRIFLAVSNLDRLRDTPLEAATIQRLILAYPKFGAQFTYLGETAALSDATILAFIDTLEQLDRIKNPGRRADIVGTHQALVAIWQILVRHDQIGPSQADASLRDIVASFAQVRDQDELFEPARRGVLRILEAAGVDSAASPQDALVDLLGGSPNAGEREQHKNVVDRINTLFTAQRLVSFKTLFDLADHFERVSRGESFNVAMANRLAETIADVRLPQSELSTPEANAMAGGNWVDNHIRAQRDLNLRRVVDQAAGDADKLSQIRGLLAPILRDSLVGLVYIHYAPPGAELIRSNPLFVRSHDFVGPESSRTWQQVRMQGFGWPASAGGRLIGSLSGLAYGINDAEQNFLVPSERQALIWQDLAPQVLLGATVPRWWKVARSELHFAALHLKLGRSLVLQSGLDSELRDKVFGILERRVEPKRMWQARVRFDAARAADALDVFTPAELFDLARLMRAEQPAVASAAGSPFADEIARLESGSDGPSVESVSRLFGVPHPQLAGAYRTELLHLPLFPTMMGYSSRILAESWESTNLYWAALADEAHLEPADLNTRIPEWTQQSIERIFATHLDDWPALLRAMRVVGERQREKTRTQLDARMEALQAAR